MKMRIFRLFFGLLLTGCGIEAIMRARSEDPAGPEAAIILAALGVSYLLGGIALLRKKMFASQTAARYLLVYALLVFSLTLAIPLLTIYSENMKVPHTLYFFGDFYAYGPMILALVIAVNLREADKVQFKSYYVKVFKLSGLAALFVVFLALHEVLHVIAHLA
ncbi:hypothetical protein [Undibacterium sp. TC9W]|uniref:hypothetical protein n=1 Tax=Undibacterium sp. TC9W TaxID=3413053 RepID=UPI003BF33095